MTECTCIDPFNIKLKRLLNKSLNEGINHPSMIRLLVYRAIEIGMMSIPDRIDLDDYMHTQVDICLEQLRSLD